MGTPKGSFEHKNKRKNAQEGDQDNDGYRLGRMSFTQKEKHGRKLRRRALGRQRIMEQLCYMSHIKVRLAPATHIIQHIFLCLIQCLL
jgi:hypothetical protein